MHWRVYAARILSVPLWRVQLSDGTRLYSIPFTCYTLQDLVGLLRCHECSYPVNLSCSWSDTVQREAQAALVRRGLSLINGPFPIDIYPF